MYYICLYHKNTLTYIFNLLKIGKKPTTRKLRMKKQPVMTRMKKKKRRTRMKRKKKK